MRKRSYAPTEKDARKQFDQMRISAVKNGETDLIQGRIIGRAMMRFGAEFILQVPRDLNVVRVETRGGSLAFTSIAANIVASTGAGLIKLDDLAGPVKIVSIPVRFAVTVKISSRYIESGSLFSPNRNAGDGVVGKATTSDFKNAFSYSWRNTKRAASALR